jgi:hypothetical protein
LSAHTAARVVTIVIGLAGVAWGASTVPVFWHAMKVDEVSRNIISGLAYQSQELRELVPVIEKVSDAVVCRPDLRKSTAVIRLRLAEVSSSEGNGGGADSDIGAAKEAIRTALSCSPTEAYLWLSLFWVNGLAHGFRPSDFALLRMSYVEGPNEGWIMTKRNHLALAIFPSLPPDLAEHAMVEFTKLLEPDFVAFAAENFIGPGWPIRELLLERIKTAPEPQRRAFAQLLKEKGYDVAVPGINLRKTPWQ